MRGRELVTLCLDEVQVVPGWERFVRRVLDSERVEVVVTGSSSALLSKEIATSLRGRAWEVPLYPFSFAEVLAHQGRAATPPRTGRARSQLEADLRSYLEVGGFPEAQGLAAQPRRQLLTDYVDVAVLRDVVERHGVSQVAGLRSLVRTLLANAGAPFSVEKFHRGLRSQGFALAKDTVHALLHHLADAFLVRPVWMESTSERQRMSNPRRIYPVDPGLVPVFDRSGHGNLGHRLETAVLIELERRRADVTWVRTEEGHEVDFLARFPDGAVELLQVCAEASDEATATREVRALEEAAASWPRATRRILTLEPSSFPDELPRGLHLQRASAWLLGAEA